MNEMWCDCKVMKVIPPTQEEIDKDAAEEQEEESKKAKDDKESPTKNKKAKKSFSPPEHLFKYELLEVEPDNPDNNPVSISTYVIIFFVKITSSGTQLFTSLKEDIFQDHKPQFKTEKDVLLHLESVSINGTIP